MLRNRFYPQNTHKAVFGPLLSMSYNIRIFEGIMPLLTLKLIELVARDRNADIIQCRNFSIMLTDVNHLDKR